MAESTKYDASILRPSQIQNLADMLRPIVNISDLGVACARCDEIIGNLAGSGTDDERRMDVLTWFNNKRRLSEFFDALEKDNPSLREDLRRYRDLLGSSPRQIGMKRKLLDNLFEFNRHEQAANIDLRLRDDTLAGAGLILVTVVCRSADVASEFFKRVEHLVKNSYREQQGSYTAAAPFRLLRDLARNEKSRDLLLNTNAGFFLPKGAQADLKRLQSPLGLAQAIAAPGQPRLFRIELWTENFGTYRASLEQFLELWPADELADIGLSSPIVCLIVVTTKSHEQLADFKYRCALSDGIIGSIETCIQARARIHHLKLDPLQHCAKEDQATWLDSFRDDLGSSLGDIRTRFDKALTAPRFPMEEVKNALDLFNPAGL